jgi:hypothetical protein
MTQKYAFVVLLSDSSHAECLADLLHKVHCAHEEQPPIVATPPVRGLQFFADSENKDIHTWWKKNIPGDVYPVYFIEHNDRLYDWIDSVDGMWYVGLPHPKLKATYEDFPQVHSFMANGPIDFATVAARNFATDDEKMRGSLAIIFDVGKAILRGSNELFRSTRGEFHSGTVTAEIPAEVIPITSYNGNHPVDSRMGS